MKLVLSAFLFFSLNAHAMYFCQSELRDATNELSRALVDIDSSKKLFTQSLDQVNLAKYEAAKKLADTSQAKGLKGLKGLDGAENHLEQIINICQDPERELASNRLNDVNNYQASAKIHMQQVEELIILLDRVLSGNDKNAYCYGYTTCPNGMTVSCYAYGPACSWQSNARGVVCNGYDQFGRWGQFWARCFFNLTNLI